MPQQELSDSKLYQGLRVTLSILKAYLAHLPLSGGVLYPEALTGALEEMAKTAGFCEELGYNWQEFDSDLRRLRKALLKEIGVKNDVKQPQDGNRSKKANEVEKSKKIDMINNLAR